MPADINFSKMSNSRHPKTLMKSRSIDRRSKTLEAISSGSSEIPKDFAVRNELAEFQNLCQCHCGQPKCTKACEQASKYSFNF